MGVRCDRECRVGERKDEPAVDDAGTVEVILFDFDGCFRPSIAVLDGIDAEMPGKSIFLNEAIYSSHLDTRLEPPAMTPRRLSL